MPCYDCKDWRRPTIGDGAQGWCEFDLRPVHMNYHCSHWKQRRISHAEVGLTPAEVAWARRHPDDFHVRELNLKFRAIEFQPQSDALRREFAERLEIWRRERANEGIPLARSLQ